MNGDSNLPNIDKPIEMEEDFAADLENLDSGEMDEGDDGADDFEPNHDEEKIEWNMGCLDEPEEQQLDPKIWDEPPEDGQEESNKLDENSEGEKL